MFYTITKDKEKLLKACEKASIYDQKDGKTIAQGNNDQKNVEDAANEMQKVRSNIDYSKKYDITAKQSEDGFYTWVEIEEKNN